MVNSTSYGFVFNLTSFFFFPFFSSSPLLSPYFNFRLKMAQESVSKLTSEKKVETKKINPTASLVRCILNLTSRFFITPEMHPGVYLNVWIWRIKLREIAGSIEEVRNKTQLHAFIQQTQQRSFPDKPNWATCLLTPFHTPPHAMVSLTSKHLSPKIFKHFTFISSFSLLKKRVGFIFFW